MASLAGTQIRNTYPGLLKTTANDAITSSLKLITDGAGNSTALKLSASKARVEALEINTVAQTQSVLKFLTYDATTGAVGYYDYSASAVPVSVSTASTDPDGFDGATITIGTDQSFGIAEGSNIQVTASGGTLTIASSVSDSAQFVNLVSSRQNPTSGPYGDVHLTFTDYNQNDTITRIQQGTGIQLNRTDNEDGGVDFEIRQDYIFHRIHGANPVVNLQPLDYRFLDVVLDVTAVHSSSTYSTITLPPPYEGRVIRIFLDSTPTSYSRTVKIAIASDEGDPNYFYGKVVVNHGNPTSGYKVQHAGKSANKTEIWLSHSDGYAGYIGDVIEITGIDNNLYHVNANLTKEYNNNAYSATISVLNG